MSKYSFRVTGIERKAVAQIIAKVTNQVSTYAGPPSFAYVIGNLSIDRSGMINAPVDKELEKILTVLSENGVIEDGAFNITMKDHTGVSLRNWVNIISSKEKLLNRALDRTGGINFDFNNMIIKYGFYNFGMNEVLVTSLRDDW
jgi:hypothetical protein